MLAKAQGCCNGERDPSSPTLPWFHCPALELTEQKRRLTGVVSLRVKERGGLWKVGYTTMPSAPKSLLRGAIGFKEKLIHLNGYAKPYRVVVHTPIVNRWPLKGGLDSEFPSTIEHPLTTGRA